MQILTWRRLLQAYNPHRQYPPSFCSLKKLTPNISTPQAGTRNILITAALPYVNNTPHLGNIIGAVLSADAYARYCRLRGYNTLFICGTDQYGTTTQVKALQQKTSPQQICQQYHTLHSQIYSWFQIKFDHFGRTSHHLHTEITNQIFRDLYNSGYAYVGGMKQFYCDVCRISLADRYVVGVCGGCGAKAKGDQCDSCNTIFKDPILELKEPKCSICAATPTVQQSKHLYLKLSQCSQTLKKWLIEENGMKNWSNNAKAVTKAWLNTGLQDRCITRNLTWGVPVPEKYLEGKKVFYVWFEAPIGYISITAAALGEGWRKWWQPQSGINVELNQFMGKDNIAFHSILAPATLQATNKPFIKPQRLSVTEYLLYEGGKFSKSNNIGIFGDNCKQTGIKSDVWRYFLLLNRPQTYDTQFLWQDLATCNKKDLMNTIGNMCLRILKYTYTNLNNEIPLISLSSYSALQHRIIDQLAKLVTRYCQQMEDVEIKAACHCVLEMGQVFNKYIQDSQFWSKGNVATQRNKVVIGVGIRLLEFYAVVMEPFLPEASKQILTTMSLTSQTVIKLPKDKEPGQFLRDIMLNPQLFERQSQKWKQLKFQKAQILYEDIPEKKIAELKKIYGVNKGKEAKNDKDKKDSNDNKDNKDNKRNKRNKDKKSNEKNPK